MAALVAAGHRPLRTWLLPVASTLAGSAMSLMPVVAEMPLFPSCGLLLALAWRLLRPEMWGAWVALPLGLADDLIGGEPLGTAMALWTLAFLALDLADHRRVWRDLWLDWQLAAVAILFCTGGGWLLARFAGGGGPAWGILPQALTGALAFPAALRLVAAMDRWRLSKGAATAP